MSARGSSGIFSILAPYDVPATVLLSAGQCLCSLTAFLDTQFMCPLSGQGAVSRAGCVFSLQFVQPFTVLSELRKRLSVPFVMLFGRVTVDDPSGRVPGNCSFLTISLIDSPQQSNNGASSLSSPLSAPRPGWQYLAREGCHRGCFSTLIPLFRGSSLHAVPQLTDYMPNRG